MRLGATAQPNARSLDRTVSSHCLHAPAKGAGTTPTLATLERGSKRLEQSRDHHRRARRTAPSPKCPTRRTQQAVPRSGESLASGSLPPASVFPGEAGDWRWPAVTAHRLRPRSSRPARTECSRHGVSAGHAEGSRIVRVRRARSVSTRLCGEPVLRSHASVSGDHRHLRGGRGLKRPAALPEVSSCPTGYIRDGVHTSRAGRGRGRAAHPPPRPRCPGPRPAPFGASTPGRELPARRPAWTRGLRRSTKERSASTGECGRVIGGGDICGSSWLWGP